MSARDSALDAVARGLVAADDTERALQCVGGVTTADTWRRLALGFLLAAGALALALGLVFFIAWNWADLHRFAKFGLVAGALIGALLVLVLAGAGSVVRTALVPVLFLLIGAAFALSDQVYQLGVDRWQLYAGWALAALPLVIGARTFFGWLPWFALVNLATVLWLGSRPTALAWLWLDDTNVFWVLAAINVAGAVLSATGVVRCESPRFDLALKRVALFVAGGLLTVLALSAIFGDVAQPVLAFAGWAAFVGAIWYRYRRVAIDLPLLAGFALSLCTVVVAGVGRLLVEWVDDFSFGLGLLIAGFIIAVAAIAGRWLLGVQREQAS